MNKTEIKIFLLYILIVALITKPYMYGDNEKSRFNTIKAIVENHTFVWNDLSTYYPTGDMILIGDKAYSDKPPFFALLCAPFYFILYIFGITIDIYPGLSTYLLKVLINGAATAYLVILFYREMLRVIDKNKSLLLACVFGVCTLLFTYATALHNHTYTALFLFIAFSLYLKYIRTGSASFFYMGLFLGLAAATDTIIGAFFIFGISISLFFLKTVSFNAKCIFIVGCILALLPYFFFNYSILGNPLLPAYAYPEYFNYEGSWQNSSNLPGFYNHDSLKNLLIYTFHSTFGARGLFSYTPLLLIGLCVLAYKSLYEKNMYFLPILFASIGVIGYFCVYTVNYGGSSYGSRYFLALTPILFYFCVYVFSEYPKWKIPFFCAAVFSGVVACIGACNPWVNMGEGVESISFVANFHLGIIYNSAVHYILYFFGIV